MIALKKLRESLSISQEALAEKIHVSRVSISRYESGTRTHRPGVLVRIADYFGVKVDDLLRDFGNPAHK